MISYPTCPDSFIYKLQYLKSDSDPCHSPEDGVNFTKLVRELRTAIQTQGKEYTVTFTVPTSYWYLQHFDLKGMSNAVDWIHIMSYDLHGIWDKTSPLGPRMFGHTNLTDIDLALDLFWRNDVAPDKLVLGLAMYGRSFKLTDPTCWRPGCLFSGVGEEGQCSNIAGILSYRGKGSEITLTVT